MPFRRFRYAGKVLPSRLSSLPPSSAPGITIIRPICGLDNNLYKTLESAMKLEYPKYEVLFALQDEKDEALPVVKMVLEKYPNVPAKVIIGMIRPSSLDKELIRPQIEESSASTRR